MLRWCRLISLTSPPKNYVIPPINSPNPRPQVIEQVIDYE